MVKIDNATSEQLYLGIDKGLFIENVSSSKSHIFIQLSKADGI